MQKIIEFADKVALNENPSIPDINKVKDTDINEIKSVVNGSLQGTNAMGSIVVDDVKCKNMFGNYVVINGWIDGTTMRVNSVNGNRMAFIPCQPNTTYTISRSVITSSFRVSDYTTIPSMTSSNVDYTIPTATKNDSGTTITYTTSSTAKYIIIHYANIGSDSSSTIESSLATIQLEVGSTATEYTEYKQPVKKTSIGVKESCTFYADDFKCRNLLNYVNSVNGAIPNNSTSEALDYNTHSLTTCWIPCKPNTTYVFSGVIGAVFRSRWQTKDENGVITFASNEATVTTNSTAKYLRIYYYYNGDVTVTPSIAPNVQIEIGSEATPYTPYKNFDNTPIITQLLGDTTLTASTSYALSDAITNYKYIMLVLTSAGSFENANRQYIPVEQIQGFSNLYRCALSLFQSTSVYMFADMYFADATHIYCNTLTRGTTGWAGHLKVYGIK